MNTRVSLLCLRMGQLFLDETSRTFSCMDQLLAINPCAPFKEQFQSNKEIYQSVQVHIFGIMGQYYSI